MSKRSNGMSSPPRSPQPYSPSKSPSFKRLRERSVSPLSSEQEGGVRPLPFVQWDLIEESAPITNDRFERTDCSGVFELNHNLGGIPDLMEFQTAIDDAYESAVRHFLKDAQPSDCFSCYISANGLEPPIYIGMQLVSNIDKRRFLDRIFKTAQSKREFLNAGLMKVKVAIYRSLTGEGRGTGAVQTYRERDSQKRSVFQIKNSDNSCGYRAIAMGKAYHGLNVAHNPKAGRWLSLRKRESAQRRDGQQLCEELDIDFNIPMDEKIIRLINERLTEYQLIVIDAKNCDQWFVGTDRPKVIYLLYDGKHYDLITKMPAFLDRRVYCKYCNKGFMEASQHKCKDACPLCHSHNACLSDGLNHNCNGCRKTFGSKECYDLHKINNLCKKFKFCPICEIEYKSDTKVKHMCDQFKCTICNEYYSTQPHHCYIQPLNLERILKEDAVNNILIAYDIECCLEKSGNISSHIPITVQSVCNDCSVGRNCETCGPYETNFYGTDCVKEFVDYLLDRSKIVGKNKCYITVFAHNNSGYDGHFVLREFLRRDIRGIEPIMNGTKIMKLDIWNIRIIDTLLLFQRPLADLPKMFGIPDETKGFFPYYLNTLANQSLKCKVKDIAKKDFGYGTMNEKRAKEFNDWYRREAESVYCLKDRMKTYCYSDVRILLRAVIEFLKLFKDVTKIDPLTRAFTLASIGFEYFSAILLEGYTIGITPINGYNNFGMQSFSANAWLDIQEANGNELIREYHIGKYFIDGMDIKNKIAYEFLGCRFHGCPCTGKDQKELDKVESRRIYLNKRGFRTVFVKECEWIDVVNNRRNVKYDKKVSDRYYERKNYYWRVKTEELYCNPRKALHGGRTNNLKFYWKCSGDEELRYLDLVSLNPHVLSSCDFPGWYPKVIRENFGNIRQYFGYVSCKVLPPKNLYIPVLPYSCDGKLLFPLCRTCAENKSQESCECSREERSFRGTFVTVELFKAMDKGYKVVEIYEILHYTNRINKQFRRYVDTWTKIEVEKSGYPPECETLEQKEKFLVDFKRKAGFALDRYEIESNPGKRTIAKLMLNSFWGKLAQRPNLPQTKVVKDRQEFWDKFTDKDIEIIGDDSIEEMLLLSYRFIDDKKSSPGKTSVAIAAFVTANARLKLLEEIERIEESSPGSVLYFDTDSIIFVHKPGNYCPTIGSYLGEMTDEIIGDYGLGARLTEFYSLGPKTYAMKVVCADGSEKTKFKAKGITQNIDSSESCNFNTIKEMATNTANDIENETRFVRQMQFRTNRQHIVTTNDINKRFNVASDKRRIVGNYTLPFGYVEDFAEMIVDMIDD